MAEIKNWPQFGTAEPYSIWVSRNMVEFAFIPLSTPCKIHADGFDCWDIGCRCDEFKFVRRSKEDIAKIERLQEEVREESILRQADAIRAARR